MSVDEMFKKLGYIKEENEYKIKYKNIYKDMNIIFYKLAHQVEAYYPNSREDYESDSGVLSMQELQAIYKKCKKMGWLNE